MVKRILQLRAKNMNLGKVSETILEECLSLHNAKKPCQDNLTLIIVSLSDYLNDWERQLHKNAQEQLALYKMTSQMFNGTTEVGSSFRSGEVYADVSSNGPSNSLNESGLQNSADA